GQLGQFGQRQILQVARGLDLWEDRGHQWFLSSTYRAKAASRSAAAPSGAIAAQASSINNSARRRLSSTPSKPGNVSLPRCESLPTRLPVAASVPRTSRRSSAI